LKLCARLIDIQDGIAYTSIRKIDVGHPAIPERYFHSSSDIDGIFRNPTDEICRQNLELFGGSLEGVYGFDPRVTQNISTEMKDVSVDVFSVGSIFGDDFMWH